MAVSVRRSTCEAKARASPCSAAPADETSPSAAPSNHWAHHAQGPEIKLTKRWRDALNLISQAGIEDATLRERALSFLDAKPTNKEVMSVKSTRCRDT
eukprot:6204819-Pleurochrysis_carterae.AAC.1